MVLRLELGVIINSFVGQATNMTTRTPYGVRVTVRYCTVIKFATYGYSVLSVRYTNA